MSERPTCTTCKFFGHTHMTGRGSYFENTAVVTHPRSFGECRRRSPWREEPRFPTVKALINATPEELAQPFNATWADWCGEHESRTP